MLTQPFSQPTKFPAKFKAERILTNFTMKGKGKYFHSCCKIYLTSTFSAHWKYHRATKCPQGAGAAKVQTEVGSLDFIASE